jgi:hypothetical protein
VGETIKRKRARQGDLTALSFFLFQLPGAFAIGQRAAYAQCSSFQLQNSGQ